MKTAFVSAIAVLSALVSATPYPNSTSASTSCISPQTAAQTYIPKPTGYGGHHGGKKPIVVELRADNGAVRYYPDRVDAKVGEQILFKFFAAAHSVTQSTFDTPCTPLNGGIDSQLIRNVNNTRGPEFERLLTVTSDQPQWFYCKQPNMNHCGQGMVFGLNPRGKMDQFIENAKRQNGALVRAPIPSSLAVPAPAAPTATVVVAPPSYQAPAALTPSSLAAPAPAATTITAVAAPPYSPAPAAPIHTVVVQGGINMDGSNSTLRFDPPFLPKINKGEQVLFDFRALNHTLTESSFADPCSKLRAPNAIDTAFQNFNRNNTPLARPFTFTLDTDADKPRYFYCAQARGRPNSHCAAGMVFALNIDGNRFADFQIRAGRAGRGQLLPRSERAFRA